MGSHASDSPAVDTMELGDFSTDWRVLPMSVLAICIGTLAAFVAKALLVLIAVFTNLFYYQTLSTNLTSPAGHTLGAVAIALPVIGALIIGAMARYGSERIRGHGIPEALEAILVGGSRVQPKVALLKPLSSAISIGSGGPFGAEGPIIMTGGAFGSLVAQLFSLTAAERKTLLVAGAAAGMSATFAAPLASVLLAVELLLFEWKPRSFVPVALASAAAAAARYFILGAGPIFPIAATPAFVGVPALVACVGCGVGAGALSGLLTGAVYAAEDFFKKLPIHWMWWPAFGGLAIGIGGLVCPQALGVGYDEISQLLHEGVALKALIVLVIVKCSIWSISLGSGTSGGVLAPLLMMGAALGGVEAHVFPEVASGFWPAVSMGAILGGTMRSPLTGVIFTLELTHDYDLVLPLIIAVAVAHLFTVLLLKRSILTEKVARRGFHISREYAVDELEVLFARDVMRTEITLFPAYETIAHARTLTEGTRDEKSQHLFPVLDPDANLVGAVTFADLYGALPDQVLGELAHPAPSIFANETLRTAVQRMAETGATRLLVLNPSDATKVVGKVALHDVLTARLKNLNEETRRERVLPIEYLLPRWLRPSPGAEE